MTLRGIWVVAAITLAASDAAALQQPNGAAIPAPMGCAGNQPTGLAPAMACQCTGGAACNIGPPCPLPGPCPVPQGSCETTLYHQANDNTCIPSSLTGLDPWHDGALTPETYTPTCPLTFSLVSRGTARFGNVFGWYNVTGARPTADELYPMLDCDDPAGTQVVLDVRSDPRWRGGEIGFFLATPEQHGASGTCAGGDCCARVDRLATAGYVYYSQRDLNPDFVGAQSIIHLVVYDSHLTDRKFYFAWEDTYGAANNDFTDLVTSVSGVECAGGGTACDTGEPGMCQYGVTACHGSTVECQRVYGPAPEVCDGADNDCDGQIDEGLGCEVFGDCGSITCSPGMVCRDGACVDPCDHVACAPGLTCLSGLCVPGCNQCNGAVCPTGRSCDLATGACVGGGSNGDAPDADLGGGDDDGGVPGTGCCDASPTPDLPALALVLGGLLVRRRLDRRRGHLDGRR